MTDPVVLKSFPPPPIDEREISRYAGARGDMADIAQIVQECIREAEDKLVYRTCARAFGIAWGDGFIDLGFARTESADLRAHLRGCENVVVFAATVGLGLDRLIARYSRISPVKALVFQALGAERIEALCDEFCRWLETEQRQEGRFTGSRFSPGYGDLPLELQKDIFTVLDCPRKIGLSLNGSLLMTPTKSVTALVGIGDRR